MYMMYVGCSMSLWNPYFLVIHSWMTVWYSPTVGYDFRVHTFRGSGATGRSTWNRFCFQRLSLDCSGSNAGAEIMEAAASELFISSGAALFILLIVFNIVAGAMKEVFNKVIDACISNRS